MSFLLAFQRGSDGRHAAVDGERLAGDEGARFGREQRDRAFQVFGAADLLHRRHLSGRVLAESPPFLRHGGALLLEVGGEQADSLDDDLARLGYVDVTVLVDEEGDARGIEATFDQR
jgi:hypothetical protein